MAHHPILFAAAAGGGNSSSAIDFDDAFDDACSICLEPFTSKDPSTATSCKHEYHLQCILEWSQRSKECPICWRLLVLKDPSCQELLAAVETVRLSRSRTTSSSASMNLSQFHEDFDVEQDSYSDDSDFDELIMQHLASVTNRAQYIYRRERQRSSGQGPSEVLIFPPLATAHSNQQMLTQDMLPGVNSPTPFMGSQSAPSVVPPTVNVVPETAVRIHLPCKSRQLPNDVPQTASEISSFSESIKSKWVAASTRFKESISKSTRGLKEKLLARNTSVKELSKGVPREMSAGIPGIARMIERLDLTSRRQTGASFPVSGCSAGTSVDFLTGKGIEVNATAQGLTRSVEIKHPENSDAPFLISCSTSGQLEVPHIQEHH